MGFDVFNALDVMENKQFLEELKFGVGDGNLHYYLYNWRCPEIPPEKVLCVLDYSELANEWQTGGEFCKHLFAWFLLQGLLYVCT